MSVDIFFIYEFEPLLGNCFNQMFDVVDFQGRVMSTPSPSLPGVRGSHESGGSSSRGRGGRGSIVSRDRADAERNLGTIHGDLFTRKPGQNKIGNRF